MVLNPFKGVVVLSLKLVLNANKLISNIPTFLVLPINVLISKPIE